jgi:hypothetical protein
MQMYSLQIVQWTYVRSQEVHYFLGYSLGNNWTYETSFDHCAKTTRRMLGLSDVRCSARKLVANFPYKMPVPPLISHTYFLPLVCPKAVKTLPLSFEWKISESELLRGVSKEGRPCLWLASGYALFPLCLALLYLVFLPWWGFPSVH